MPGGLVIAPLPSAHLFIAACAYPAWLRAIFYAQKWAKTRLFACFGTPQRLGQGVARLILSIKMAFQPCWTSASSYQKRSFNHAF
jgi:hypothetical protein